MRRLLVPLVAITLLVLTSAGGSRSAHANGVPQIVKLTYLDGVSNWGPKDAEGVFQFSFAEAFARIEVKNLPPVAGMTYSGWLVAPGGRALSIGEIVPQPSGVATAEAKLTNLDGYDYNLFVIAGRPSESHDSGLPAQKSIAGRFSVLADSATGKPAGDTRPAVLPDAGEAEPGWPWPRMLTTAGAAIGAGLVVGGWRRYRHAGGSR